MVTLPPNFAKHIPFYGSRLLHGQGNLCKTSWRPYERFECEFGYLESVHEYHSSSSSSSRKRLWRECKICKKSSLENCGTAFQGNRKAGQWSARKRWHMRDWFQRFEVDVDKLIAQSSRAKFTGIRTTIFHDLNRIDAQLVELEWKIFQGFITAGILN